MKLEEARSVRWSGKEFKGQRIGELLDEGKLILSDLTYATEYSPDAQVREATRAIVLHILTGRENKPTSQKIPLNVVTSERRSYSERRQLQYAMLDGFVMGIVMGVFLMLFFASVINTINARANPQPLSEHSREILSSPQGIVVTIIILLFIVGSIFLLFRATDWITNRIDKRIQLHRKGQRGEDRVTNAMFLALDGDWWLFRNLELPGQKQGDIDFVLVSAKGVWAIEAKAYGGEYRNVGEKWEHKVGSRWLPTFKNPTRQAKKQASLLSHILKTNNIKQWVNPAIVWANEESTITIENPAVFVWELNTIRQELDKLSDNRRMSNEQVKQIVRVLQKLYKEPFEQSELTDS